MGSLHFIFLFSAAGLLRGLMGINNMYNITVCDKAWPDIYLRGLMGINNMYNITVCDKAWPDIY